MGADAPTAVSPLGRGSPGAGAYTSPVRRYHLTTFGCQMNSHDSERIKGMLESLGLGEATSKEDADVVVFNTCTIREKPDTKLSAYLGDAGARKRENPDLVIAVGGCFAEAQQERIFDLYPQVDVAFGPGSIPHLGDWVGAGGEGVERGRFGTHEHFAGHLPQHRERAAHAWVQVSMGCNSTCSYCIVPAVRGREQSRRPGDIVAEVTQLAADGVREITLLGQNVNSWGRDLAPDIRTEFGELLRACDAVDGIERIRFTSPHPKDFREPVIAAMAECDAVCEHIHLPLQSGSTRILKAMRRTYSRERYLDARRRGCATRSPTSRSARTSSSAFPGETEEDFEETLAVVEEVRYDSAFTFIYSPRRGHRRGGDGRSGARARQARAARAARRGRAARSRPSGTPSASAASSRCSSKGRAGPIRRSCAAAPDATRPSTSPARAAAGDLVDVAIEGSTSTTLRGRVASAVPA